ncbi:hypothetical protein ACF0H5_014039 [Mactra antiquata]
MSENSTFVCNPSKRLDTSRQFTYDYSYWSHDGYTCAKDGYMKPTGDTYADQKRVFEDLGTDLIKSAWSGYNCTLFAYGQTGSGKTYSMMGYEPNQGVIPRLCESLYQDIDKKTNPNEGIMYRVSFSMLEIYNEKVYDLMNVDSNTQDSLAVKMTPKQGPLVDGLQSFSVSSYKDITYYIDECNKRRTMAVTRMNETSSRAHTIVTLTLVQNNIRERKLKTSKINLVDLAGSERASQTGATGVRFEESKNINKSLMTLGIVIKNLCATACGRTDQGPAPYRDSKLTMLLKDAIGGNCTTIMLATISPSDEDYEQTISTLRYADRVKSIRNTVVVNITDTEQLIKELQTEKDALLMQLVRRNSQMGNSEQEILLLKQKQLAEIDKMKNEMMDMEKEWNRKLQQTKHLMEEHMAKEKKLEQQKRKIPHLINLNEDPALSGKICHFIKAGLVTTIGNTNSSNSPEIILHGPSIGEEHAAITNYSRCLKIVPLQGQVKVNGLSITEPTPLRHLDRLFFSVNNLFVYHNPAEELVAKKRGDKHPVVTFDMAQNEIGKHSKLHTGLEWLKEEIGEMLVHTHEANSMATALKRGIRFEPVMVPSLVLGDKQKPSQIFVKAATSEGGEFLWGRDQFFDRLDLMMSIFQKYVNGEDDWEPKTQKQDPFWEPMETPTLIGVTYITLESIAYMLDIGEQKIGIYDYQAKYVGHLIVCLIPCTMDGTEESEDLAVDSPSELIGKSISFKIKITGATSIPQRYRSSWCHYCFNEDQGRVYSDEVLGIAPKYNFEHIHTINNVTPKTIECLQEDSVMIEVYGRQRKSTSTDHRRGSTVDAYTISDRRRTSTVFTADQRAMSKLLTKGISPSSKCDTLVEVDDENDADDDDSRISKSRQTYNIGEKTDSDYDSTSSLKSENNTSVQIPDIVKDSTPSSSSDQLSDQMKQLRTGISSVMDTIMKRQKIADLELC